METRNKLWAKTNEERRAKLLNDVCKELDYAVLMSPTGKMPYGEVAKIVKDLKEDNLWLNRNVVNFAFKKFQPKKKKIVDLVGKMGKVMMPQELNAHSQVLIRSPLQVVLKA